MKIIAACIAASLGMATCGSAFAQTAAPKPERMIVNSSGGSWNAAMRKYFWDEFQNKNGIKITDTSPTDLGKLRAMVGSGNISWSVTEIGGQDTVRAVEMGLVEPLDAKVIDRSNFVDAAKDPNVFAPVAYSTVIAFRPDAFADGGPTSWADFWNVKKFPGPRALRDSPVDNLEAALLADGVPVDKLYPLDVDRAFKKLDEIYPNVTVWWTTGQQPAQLLIDKEVVLASGWNGRFFDLIRKKAPIKIEWNGGVLKIAAFVIPKGAKDKDWGMKVLAGMTDAKRQAALSEELGYSGTNKDADGYVSAETRPLLPLSPDNLAKQVWLNVDWWTKNGAAVTERWQKWKLSKS